MIWSLIIRSWIRAGSPPGWRFKLICWGWRRDDDRAMRAAGIDPSADSEPSEVPF